MKETRAVMEAKEYEKMLRYYQSEKSENAILKLVQERNKWEEEADRLIERNKNEKWQEALYQIADETREFFWKKLDEYGQTYDGISYIADDILYQSKTKDINDFFDRLKTDLIPDLAESVERTMCEDVLNADEEYDKLDEMIQNEEDNLDDTHEELSERAENITDYFTCVHK